MRGATSYVERATVVAQKQYKSQSLLTGLQAVSQVKGWKVQQIVCVGGTCGSIHVESFNRNMKSLGVRESKWDPIRKKLGRRLLEEQDKVVSKLGFLFIIPFFGFVKFVKFVVN
jgi:hypothetical protein